MLSGHFHREILELHRKYGPVIRIAPRELVYADAVIWRDAYANRPGQPAFPRSTIMENVNGASDIISANEEDHDRFRSHLSRAFSENSLRKQESTILSHVDVLMRQLLTQSAHGNAVDLAQWFSFAVFDIIGDLSFGKPFGCLETGQLHPWINSTFGNLKAIIYFDVLRDYALMPLVSLLMPRSLQKARLESYHYAYAAVKNRIEHGDDNRDDFVSAILGHNSRLSETNPDHKDTKLTFPELVNNTSLLLAAGSLSLTALLPGCLALLLQHPLALKRATTELRHHFQSSSEITLSSVTSTDGVSRIPYLLAALNESMRLHPPNPTVPPRLVPRGGATVAGVFLPAHTHVQIVPYAANRLPENFARPTEFRPERWLDSGHGDNDSLGDGDSNRDGHGDRDGDAEFASDRRDVFKPFSVGARNCMGQNLAAAEMRVIVARLLFQFDVEVAEGEGEGEMKRGRRDWDWAAGQKTHLLWEKRPLWVKIVPRGESS